MNAVSNPIALAALNRAIKTIKKGPVPIPSYNSRTADKFVIRGYVELFDELGGIGRHQSRSMNSEAVAAVLSGLNGHTRSTAMLRVLKQHLGEEVSSRVLLEVPDFDLAKCRKPKEFVLRFPTDVRDTVRADVEKASTHATSMNRWILGSLVEWIKIQRQLYALLTAAVAIDTVSLGTVG